MRTRKVIVLLLLCTIGFTGCSEDDNQPGYHLELSTNSCEVMQGRSIAIDLTAHENSTLEIENPELIEGTYIWESDYQKAKLKITAKQVGETTIVITDHETDESATIKVTVTEYPMPRLGAKQSKGNIYDMINFYLYNEGTHTLSITFSELAAVCDSIVWTADGLKGSFRTFDHEQGEGWSSQRLSMEWGHCFKYPGEYKTYLSAWKNNKVFSRQQLDITIANNKDFLLYNWNDITTESSDWMGYADVLKSTPDLILTQGLTNAVPYAETRVFSSKSVQSRQILYDYFCKIYAAPAYENTTEMGQLYNELFSPEKKYPAANPVAIWTTEHSHIALLLLYEGTEFPKYTIYTEPNNN